MTDKERADLEDAEAVCRRFLAWDLDVDQEENVRERLKTCLGRTTKEDVAVAEY
jgi:DNA mismatch repair protein MSH5